MKWWINGQVAVEFCLMCYGRFRCLVHAGAVAASIAMAAPRGGYSDERLYAIQTDTGGYTLFVLAQCRLLARPARRCVRELTPDQERITSYTDVTPCAVQISRFIRVRRNIFVYVRYPNTRRILKAYYYYSLFISVVFTVYIKIYFVYSLLFN